MSEGLASWLRDLLGDKVAVSIHAESSRHAPPERGRLEKLGPQLPAPSQAGSPGTDRDGDGPDGPDAACSSPWLSEPSAHLCGLWGPRERPR